jgi:hypothetical protein
MTWKVRTEDPKSTEGYWSRLTRISASHDNRIFSSHHLHANHTVYKLGLINNDFNIIFHPVVCKTISMMEFE